MRDHSYRLATYAAADGEPRAAVVVDDRVIAVSDALADSVAKASSLTSVLAVLRRWDEVHPLLKQVARDARAGKPVVEPLDLPSVQLLAPILYPGTILCAGANYRDHVAEMSKALNLPPEPDPHELGLKPWHFIKASAACVRGPKMPILPSCQSPSKKVQVFDHSEGLPFAAIGVLLRLFPGACLRRSTPFCP